MNADEQKLTNFCQALPKVELHAHFNGSISKRTVAKIVKYHQSRSHNVHLNTSSDKKQDNSSSKVTFASFVNFHKLTIDAKSVELAVFDVVEDFAKDGVKYLELRTTPRENLALDMKLEDYIKALLSGICVASQQNDIIVKVLLSINRAESSSKAIRTVDLAKQYFHQTNPVIVGIDFSGDPSKGECEEFIPILKSAKEHGLKLSVHIAEECNQEHESSQLLSVLPDRIGHGVHLHKFKPDLYDVVLSNKIPLEICLTSNICTGQVSCYENSHFTFWYDRQHPLTICTDDKGIFNSDLSSEYFILSKHLQISPQSLWELSYKSIDFIFDSSLKSQMRSLWEKVKDDVFHILS